MNSCASSARPTIRSRSAQLAIRAKLAELVGELSATMPTMQETPTAEQATQAIHFVQTGKRSTITDANAQSATGGTSTVTQGAQPAADPRDSSKSRALFSLVKGI